MDAKRTFPMLYAVVRHPELDNLITFTGDIIRVELNLEHGVILVAVNDLAPDGHLWQSGLITDCNGEKRAY
jgi:hypothetical protein